LKKNLQAVAVFAIAIITISVPFAVFLNAEFGGQTAESFSPGYLLYQGKLSKIYLVTSTSSYGNANETYTTPAGQFVQQGSPLFIITVTLRNDYSSEEAAPPPNEVPVSPADGTAYVYFTAKVYDENGAVNATNVTVPDFSLPSTPGTALVLSSGQTASANIYTSTDKTGITKYGVEVIFLGDSIPTK